MPALAHAESAIGDWQLGSAVQRDSRQQTAVLRATELLPGSGSTPDYAPALVIACTEGDKDHWQQQFILEEPLTRRGIIDIWVILDGGKAEAQQWVVTGNKRVATRVGAADVAKIARAKQMKLQWNWGWSWLWLSDEATFELGDIRSVLFTLAAECAVPVPR